MEKEEEIESKIDDFLSELMTEYGPENWLHISKTLDAVSFLIQTSPAVSLSADGKGIAEAMLKAAKESKGKIKQ